MTKTAAECGARPGARLTDARALDPSLVAVPADPEGDAALVQRLAKWAGRWSPLVEVDGDGLRLDVTGVAHLFGGERGLVRDVERRFAMLRFSTRVAIAPTATAAWALAHYAPCICDGGAAARLAPLHVSALRLDPDTVRTLERLGLKTIGALLDMPRLALARRFRGVADVVDALDRALGRKPEPLTAAPSAPTLREIIKLEEPATHPEAAPQALERLIPDLVRRQAAVADRLSRRRQHCSRVRRYRHSQPRLEASTAAARRQDGRARSGVRVRCVRADRRLGRGPGRRAGQPGRGTFRDTRARAAGRPVDGEAWAQACPKTAAGRKPSSGAGIRLDQRACEN